MFQGTPLFRVRHFKEGSKGGNAGRFVQNRKKKGVLVTVFTCFVTDLLNFRSEKQWYVKTGIPYRRGYLLYGPPGTGKTSFIQSLASKVHLNVALISLTTAMNDDDFVQALVEAPKNSIVVMEDIDHCTINDGEEGDSKKAPEKRVTATGLLNALDGVFSPEGSRKSLFFFYPVYPLSWLYIKTHII